MSEMTDKIYNDGFDSWADVQSSFEAAEPEPEEVFVADYELDGYEGYARVVYRNGDRYYRVEGSHCSCFGLEGQFEPTEYDSRDELVGALAKMADDSFWAPVIERINAA